MRSLAERLAVAMTVDRATALSQRYCSSNNADRRHAYLWLNLAVTKRAAFIATVHVPVPEHAPPHPWNRAPVFGAAVSVTTAPGA